jgi:hypothetical protein
LNLGFNATLPWQAYASTNVYYRSGFTNGLPDSQYPGNYLPGNTAFHLSLGENFAEKYSVSVTALNVPNRRVELDNRLTFGGFHYNDPRQIYAEFRYRCHHCPWRGAWCLCAHSPSAGGTADSIEQRSNHGLLEEENCMNSRAATNRERLQIWLKTSTLVEQSR